MGDTQDVRPATAMGHLTGKLSTVLYAMLRTMAVYDEAKYRREMGLPPLVHDTQATDPPLEIEMDLVDDVDLPDELDVAGLVASESA
jgi:hypothetical protein